VEARECWHQGRVNVQNTVRESIYKGGTDYPHKARKYNQPDVMRPQRSYNFGVEFFPHTILRRNEQRLQSAFAGAMKPWRGFDIAYDERDRGVQTARVNVAGNGFEVRTASRQQNA